MRADYPSRPRVASLISSLACTQARTTSSLKTETTPGLEPKRTPRAETVHSSHSPRAITILPASAGISKGIDVGVAADHEGVSRSKTPDLGAYEHLTK